MGKFFIIDGNVKTFAGRQVPERNIFLFFLLLLLELSWVFVILFLPFLSLFLSFPIFSRSFLWFILLIYRCFIVKFFLSLFHWIVFLVFSLILANFFSLVFIFIAWSFNFFYYPFSLSICRSSIAISFCNSFVFLVFFSLFLFSVLLWTYFAHAFYSISIRILAISKVLLDVSIKNFLRHIIKRGQWFFKKV